MKNQFLIILFIFLGSTLYSSANAQSLSVEAIENAVKEDGKYAILASNSRYFQAAVKTGVGLKAKNQEVDFEIVLIGPVVKDLAQDESLKSVIEMGEKIGIRIVVCEFAMEHAGLEQEDFHNSIQFTPDGFLYLFGLEEVGYKTITL